jgi:hypothetical protein
MNTDHTDAAGAGSIRTDAQSFPKRRRRIQNNPPIFLAQLVEFKVLNR